MKKLIKWLSIGFGSLIALIVAAAIIVPFVVDVDKYRPQIVQAASEHINGKLELGKLSLSLWGQIRVQVQGLQLSDPSGRKVVSVSDAFFHLPFLSILSGSPEMIFKMDRPEVIVVKNKQGKLNLMGLMKPSAPAPGTPAANGAASGNLSKPVAGTPAAATELPAIVAHSRLGVELKNALLTYKDELTGLDTQVKDLNFVAKDISLTRTTDIEVWADMDTRMGKTLLVRGPARMTAHAKPELVNGAFDHATVDAKINLDDLDIASGAMFEKKKGMAANADIALVASAKEATIQRFNIKFFNAVIESSGKITNMGALPAADGTLPPSPVVLFKMKSNDIDLKSWNQLVPMLNDYELAGTAKLDASANGPSDKLQYQAKLTIGALTAKAPQLKSQPRFDAVVDVATDQIQSLELTMKAPGNEMKFKGKLISFTKSQGSFELTSTGMDLDQLIDWPPPVKPGAAVAAAPTQGDSKSAAAPGTATAPGSGQSGGNGAPAGADLDASVDSLRINPMAANASAVVAVNIKMLKAKGIKMSDMAGRMYFRDLVAGLDGFAMKLWNGTVKANFATQLKPKTPTYTFSTVVDNMDLKMAVADNVAMFKNTVVGMAHFDLNGSGASFNPEPAKSNLKAKGAMRVANATFGTIDVGKMASDAVNKAIERIGDKVPQAKGKTVGGLGGKESRYEMISSTFTIDGGQFHAPDFATKAAPNQGIDLKGDTQVGLKDYALKTRWEVVDTFNLLKAKDISVNVGGVQVDHLLAEGNGPVKFVVSAGCTCFQPCYSYTEVPEYLGKVALNNVTSAATGHAKSELQKRVQAIIPKAAPPAVQNAIEDLGKKFFH